MRVKRFIRVALASLALITASTTFYIGAPSIASASIRSAVLTTRYYSSPINVRSAPTVNSDAFSYGFSGDRVEVISQTQGDDGYVWYQVRQVGVDRPGWVRGDLISIQGASQSPTPGAVVPPTPRPTPTPTPAASPTPRPVSSPNPVDSQFRGYTTEQINYFMEIAMNAEWGNTGGTVRKWSGDVRIKYFGTPTQEDLRTLNSVISEINSLANNSVRLQLVTSNPNVEIYFAPESQFSSIEPNYVPRNLGFFWTWWNDNDVLNRARILITTVGVTQQERSHLLREELTQSMGLMQDSWRYQDSVFYQGWTSVTQYTPMDRALISMLYRPEIRAGMTRSQVTAALRGLNIATRSVPQATSQTTSQPASSGSDPALRF